MGSTLGSESNCLRSHPPYAFPSFSSSSSSSFSIVLLLSWVGPFQLQLDFMIQIFFFRKQFKILKRLEMHFWCAFSPFRIQTFTWSHPCITSTCVHNTLTCIGQLLPHQKKKMIMFHKCVHLTWKYRFLFQ